MTTPTGSNKKARILVVDDHPLLREGVMQLINRQRDLAACADAASLIEAQAALEKHTPDLILLDLRLGGGMCWNSSNLPEHAFQRCRF